jgi:F-type H+-transporting ATPase subunit gamma
MPGGGQLKFYKEKLDGFKKYYQIVKTVKMVTMAKFKLTQERVKMRDQTLRFARKAFQSKNDIDEEEIIAQIKKAVLYIPLTSVRGSCGSLNNNVFRYLEEHQHPNMRILAVGKKGDDILPKKMDGSYERSVVSDGRNPPSFQHASYIWEHALDTAEGWERAQVVFTRFQQASVQKLARFNIPSFDEWMEAVQAGSQAEPKAGEVDEDNLNNYMFHNAVMDNGDEARDFYDFHASLAVLNALQENELSEYAMRLVAVENQLNNINQLMIDFDFLYNKTRKEGITAELLEIIGTMTAMAAGQGKGVPKVDFWKA